MYVDRWCVIQYGNLRALQWQRVDSLRGRGFIDVASSWDNPFERRRELMQVMRSEQAQWQSLECCFDDGCECWFKVDKIPTRDNDGQVNGALLILEDVSDSIQQERVFKESESRYRAIIKNSTDALWHYDVRPPVDTRLPVDEQVNLIYRRAHLIECNDKLASLFELTSPDNLVGTPLYVQSAVVKKEDVRKFVENNYRLENNEFYGTNSRAERLLLETSAIGEVENNHLVRFWGTSRDITEQKRYLDRMEYLANHDSLTGLPNRVLLYRRMEDAFKSRLSHQKLALLLIDLDRFKEINDTLGHLAGDKVLKQIGPRLQSELGEVPGVIARLGGDEFAILLLNIRNAQQAIVMGHRFLDAICQMFELDGYRTEISASVGVAITPDQAEDVTTMMRYADIAMYHAKTRLKGVSIYDPNFDSHSPFRLELMGALGRAIREDELRLHFQPKVRVSDDHVYGFESLLRWEHPELGFVPPGEFIPIAEMSNVIYPMTLWVMEETVKQCAIWVNQGFEISIAMNLSARNLLDDRIVGDLKRVLDEYGLSGEHLEMEITESMIMSDPKRAQMALERISALGVKLSVDDFGTGYSSLAYLKRLPVQTLKIDCAFIQGMLDDEHDEIIVNSTIQLAHNLGLSVVAEGVENYQTYVRLNELGCDAAQGFFIAKPMDIVSAENWLLQDEWLSPSAMLPPSSSSAE
ncbi:MAG: EAL domain-containing protein [Agarilytica sp.]